MAVEKITIAFVVEATDILKIDNVYDEVTKTHVLKLYKTDGTTVKKSVIPVMSATTLGVAFEL